MRAGRLSGCQPPTTNSPAKPYGAWRDSHSCRQGQCSQCWVIHVKKDRNTYRVVFRKHSIQCQAAWAVGRLDLSKVVMQAPAVQQLPKVPMQHSPPSASVTLLPGLCHCIKLLLPAGAEPVAQQLEWCGDDH